MKRIFCLILALLTLSHAALADTLSLSEMTTAQLLDMKNQIDAALLTDHAVSEDAEARLRALIVPAVNEAGLALNAEWEDCAVTREWELFVLTASAFIQNGIVERPAGLRIEAVLSEVGDRLIFLSVGDTVLIDCRSELDDPRLPALWGLALSDSFETETDRAADNVAYVCNTNTRKFHHPTCKSVSDILPDNRLDSTDSRDALIQSGYKPCGRCNP